MYTRTTKRRTELILGLTLALALLVASCGPSQTPEASPTAAAVEPTEAPAVEPTEPPTAEQVTIYVMVNDAFARMWQEELVPEFNEHCPNIEVIVDGVPYAEMLPKMMLELTSGGTQYDVFVAGEVWVPQLAATGLMADLKADFADLTDEDYDWDDFHPAPLAGGYWDGGQYGVPVRSNLLLMMYNRDLFEDAGMDADEVLTGIQWPQFEEVVANLVRDTDGDGEDDVWGFATYFGRDQLTPTIWQSILNSNGGQLFDESLHPVFNTDLGAEALAMHIGLGEVAGPPGWETYWFTDILEAFRQSKVGVIFNWSSAYRSVAVDPEATTLTADQVGIAAMPGGTTCPDGSAHPGVWLGGIPKDAPNKEAAWQFLQWVSSTEGEIWQFANIGSFPARVSTITSEPSEDWQGPVLEAILDGYDAIDCGGMRRPRLPDYDAVQEILAFHHSRAVLGEASPEEALDDAAQEIEELLEDKGYYE